MKNTLKKLLAISLAVVMLFALVGCDKSSAVKKAFEGAGYQVETKTAQDEDVKTLLKILFSEEQIEKMGEYELIYCSMDGLLNVGKKALIVKFPAAGDLESFLTVEKEDGTKDTSKLEQAEKDGWINGNCLILTLSSDCLTVFKEA